MMTVFVRVNCCLTATNIFIEYTSLKFLSIPGLSVSVVDKMCKGSGDLIIISPKQCRDVNANKCGCCCQLL